MKNKIIIISGPTATGKTKLALEIATKHSRLCEIVNFDSLLFYQEISIGTAKPSKVELSSVPHHLIDIQSVLLPMNASEFILLAQEKIAEIHSRGAIAILAGGSGFYLRALIKGMYVGEGTSSDLRQEVEELYQNKGIAPIIEYLKVNDPESLSQLHHNDHYRLKRAYEHHRINGSKFSQQRTLKEEHSPYDFSHHSHANWEILHIYLDIPREEHWKIIQNRAQKMLAEGLIAEAQGLLDLGMTGEERPLKSIGPKEAIEFIQGTIKSREELIERISVATRQLAKSQRTFFKKITPKNSFDPLREWDSCLKKVDEFLTKIV